jgi:hypothetical protein
MNYNDWKPPDKDPSREHLTSTDNPLRALNIIPQPQAVEVGCLCADPAGFRQARSLCDFLRYRYVNRD